MGMILPRDQWFIQLTGIPEFGTTIVTTGGKMVHLVGIVVHSSYYLTMSIIKCPVEAIQYVLHNHKYIAKAISYVIIVQLYTASCSTIRKFEGALTPLLL